MPVAKAERRPPIHLEGESISLGPTMTLKVTKCTPEPSWDVLEGKTDDGTDVVAKALSLKRMGGDWAALDALQAGGMTQRVASGPGVPAFLGNYEVRKSS